MEKNNIKGDSNLWKKLLCWLYWLWRCSAVVCLTMTTAVNMFLKTAIRENRIPFELKLEEEPNEVTLEAMREADRIARDDSVKGYDSIEDLREVLGV